MHLTYRGGPCLEIEGQGSSQSDKTTLILRIGRTGLPSKDGQQGLGWNFETCTRQGVGRLTTPQSRDVKAPHCTQEQTGFYKGMSTLLRPTRTFEQLCWYMEQAKSRQHPSVDPSFNQELSVGNEKATAASRMDARRTRWINGIPSFKRWEGDIN
ncbi:hypothetical protein K438DRAFT_1760495 [Mycena galopus ATCC 62051]|nr:hypothetical protein K438DRAFT_1760495 [Mycena galopus ATCC 62051]